MFGNKRRDEQISMTCDRLCQTTRSVAWCEKHITALQLEVAKLQNEAADVRRIVSKCSRDILNKADDRIFTTMYYRVEALLDHLGLESVEVATHTEIKLKEEPDSDEA